jgi:hypothetical protein
MLWSFVGPAHFKTLQESAATLKPKHLLRGQGRRPGPGSNIQDEIVALRITAARSLAV